MRSIRERLQSMDTVPARPQPREPEGVPIDAVAAGAERMNHRGSYYLVDSTVADPTGGAFARRSTLLPASFVQSNCLNTEVRAEDMLFLDTETTGLDRGTGTHVFLVGAGYFDGNEFRVQQYFIRDLYEEASLLHDLEQHIREFPVMVTFNGRAFDWPLLYNRFILHGYRSFPEFAHWDLLPSSRRVWKQRLRDCSLGNLERCVLGVERRGDVPGYLIPQLYFDYLRSRDARPLGPVFNHNQQDIVSLARLADLLACAEQDPIRTLDHPVDRLNYGLHLLQSGMGALAEQLVREALETDSVPPDLRHRACRALATCYKRQGRWDEAIEIWRRMRSYPWSGPEQALYPFLELAKAYEHRLRDYASALETVERAMNLVALHGWSGYHDALAYRYARLIRRQSGLRNTANGGMRE